MFPRNRQSVETTIVNKRQPSVTNPKILITIEEIISHKQLITQLSFALSLNHVEMRLAALTPDVL